MQSFLKHSFVNSDVVSQRFIIIWSASYRDSWFKVPPTILVLGGSYRTIITKKKWHYPPGIFSSKIKKDYPPAIVQFSKRHYLPAAVSVQRNIKTGLALNYKSWNVPLPNKSASYRRYHGTDNYECLSLRWRSCGGVVVLSALQEDTTCKKKMLKSDWLGPAYSRWWLF